MKPRFCLLRPIVVAPIVIVLIGQCSYKCSSMLIFPSFQNPLCAHHTQGKSNSSAHLPILSPQQCHPLESRALHHRPNRKLSTSKFSCYSFFIFQIHSNAHYRITNGYNITIEWPCLNRAFAVIFKFWMFRLNLHTTRWTSWLWCVFSGFVKVSHSKPLILTSTKCLWQSGLLLCAQQ